MLPQQYCLRWRYHHSNLQTMFSQLLERQAFCDVTLACEGQTLKAHKIVLSACSTYFDTILSQYEEKDPILIMKDVKFIDIKCLVEFMYKGEINVDHCHLATLLKTAEDLRVKGLAEVSWREEETGNDQTMNGVNSIMPQVSTIMDTQEPVNKRKRGRPPIDDYDQQFTSPKITSVSGNVQGEDNYSNTEVSNSDADLSVWEDDTNHEHTETNHKYKTESMYLQDDYSMDDHNDSSSQVNEPKSSPAPSTHNTSTAKPSTHNQTMQSSSSAAMNSGTGVDGQWPDVVKMNDYLNTGRRQQFWEEPFTKRVMDAIKNKDLEMKAAAELLGVSYGTLYGRYRDAYGCLKHPYRVRDFWTEQGPADVLAKLQRKEITLFRAAEQLNVTPQTLSNYLLSLHQGTESIDMALPGQQAMNYDGYEEIESEEEDDLILPDTPAKASSSVRNSISTSVLPNHPDITIIKKEKKDEKDVLKVNNNPDHSDVLPDNSDA